MYFQLAYGADLNSSVLSLSKRIEATGGADVSHGPAKWEIKDIFDRSCTNNPSSKWTDGMIEVFDKKKWAFRRNKLA